MPFTSSIVQQIMASRDFVTFTANKKVKLYFKKGQCVSNRCKDLFKRKTYFEVRCSLNVTNNSCLYNIWVSLSFSVRF